MGKRSDYKNLIETIFSFVFLDNSEKATLYIFPERLRLQYEYRAYDYVLSLQYTTRKRTYTFRNLPYTHCRRFARICAKTRRGCLQYERAHRIYILLLLFLSPRSYTRDNNIRDFAVSGRDLPTTHNIVSCAVPL
jgi:hypothetical protein